MTQPLLPLAPLPEPVIGPRPGTVTAEERPRLSRQCRLILNRLQQGSVSNDELAAISRKYTGRISEIRAAGWDVQVIDRDFKTGVTRYALIHTECS